MTTIPEKIAALRSDIQKYSPHPGRVRIVAVSKKQPLDKIQAAVDAGILDIGENRIQDALDKFAQRPFPGVTRHFIGQLQTNKAIKCLQNFDWLHSLQTEKLARIIADSDNRIHCLIEVNISGETNKSGLEPEALRSFVQTVREYRGLDIRGLMGMAAFTADETAIRASFALLRELAASCRDLETEHVRLRELSMGMTNDYTLALEEGATMIRIGTGLFGPRSNE
ncbi:MAG: YggS family pyridoxal phosphate-dependent enzyme [Candidatus Marinimicrobia bacterium]|nr:YggS family pyridoxal phosphate-dependent enzyme [Candidatus Neomarinimicrobiota bacterium]